MYTFTVTFLTVSIKSILIHVGVEKNIGGYRPGQARALPW